MIAAAVFWAAVITIVWVYVGYPAVRVLVGRVRPSPRARAPLEVPVSVVVAAHNEDAIIASKSRTSSVPRIPRHCWRSSSPPTGRVIARSNEHATPARTL
jgi:hypothetical protein